MLKKEAVIEKVLKQVEEGKLVDLNDGFREYIPIIVSLTYNECEKSLKREREVGEDYHEHCKANPIIGEEW